MINVAMGSIGNTIDDSILCRKYCGITAYMVAIWAIVMYLYKIKKFNNQAWKLHLWLQHLDFTSLVVQYL